MQTVIKKSKKFLNLCKKYGVDPANIPVEVLSFEEGCKLTGDDPKALPIVKGLPKKRQKKPVADHKLTIIAEAMKGGKNADYTTDEDKYFAVFKVKADKKRPSGFALSADDFSAYWAAGSGVGVRFVFPNWDMAKFFAMHNIALHQDSHLYT